MADVFVFADEAGNFDFSLNGGASRFFVISTVTLDPRVVAPAMTALRYDLGWRGLALDSVFHASTDAQAVRDEVFATLTPLPLRIDATILEEAESAAASPIRARAVQDGLVAPRQVDRASGCKGVSRGAVYRGLRTDRSGAAELELDDETAESLGLIGGLLVFGIVIAVLLISAWLDSRRERAQRTPMAQHLPEDESPPS